MVRPVLAVLIVSIFVIYIHEVSAQNDSDCGPNQVYDSCGSACPPMCPRTNRAVTRRQLCAQVCRVGCRCRSGFLRRSDGACVKRSECAVNTRQ